MISRESIKPRSRRWFWAVCFLAGCATATLRQAAHNESTGVPMSIWNLRFDSECAAYYAAPAVLCVPGLVPHFDGCAWSCREEKYPQ